MNKAAQEFIKKHGLDPEAISPEIIAPKMLENMLSGLAGNIVDMPMIPTFLKGMDTPPMNKPVMVIDAGGTNYRCALASFNESGCSISNLFKAKMPGTDKPVTWDEFIAFVADSLVPVASEADTVGFCFSYDAEITPNVDGIVNRIDKEVVVTGCEGKLVGEALSSALAQRGFPGKRVLILNDTVAALLGGSAAIDVSRYSDFVGMICGTGINTCASASYEKISKLDLSGSGKMLINFECGAFSGIPSGDVDLAVDAASHNPGEKPMEKMCSGVYVGKICAAAFKAAVGDQLFSEAVKGKLEAISEKIGGRLADEWAQGIDSENIFGSAEELEIASEIAKAVFRRSAHCMASVILAIMLLNDSGKTPDCPMCVCAEGSLISRSTYFLPELKKCLKEISEREEPRFAEIVVGNETTLPGSAVAALLN
ncbi:MAG: hypothetical protein Q4F31_06160 [Eubacteriales bacterium]|nr:hypothetical protein [Eubacteriales bacterium]